MFRPLPVLGSVTPAVDCVILAYGAMSFRPLAGLSCLNQTQYSSDDIVCIGEFPSPRGVELHKP